MPAPSKLDTDEALVRIVVEEYAAGATLHNLACQHKLSWRRLRQTLVDQGVVIRSNHRRGDGRYRGPRLLNEATVARLRAAIGYQESWKEVRDDSL
jgi:hypothetical protein